MKAGTGTRGAVFFKEITGVQAAALVITKNYSSHPVTSKILRENGVVVPDQELTADGKNKFWDGNGYALAARPRGGVRAAAQVGDTQISSLDELELILFIIVDEENLEEV